MRSIAVSLVVSMLGGVLPALAQSPRDADKEVRIVGCVQWEKDSGRSATKVAAAREDRRR